MVMGNAGGGVLMFWVLLLMGGLAATGLVIRSFSKGDRDAED